MKRRFFFQSLFGGSLAAFAFLRGKPKEPRGFSYPIVGNIPWTPRVPEPRFREIEVQFPKVTGPGEDWAWEWKPWKFEDLRPGATFRWKDEGEWSNSYTCASHPKPCDPPGNFLIDILECSTAKAMHVPLGERFEMDAQRKRLRFRV